MVERTDLQTLLEQLTTNVFYQPPSSTHLTYPCILYKLDDIVTFNANNRQYFQTRKYAITVIDKNPDSALADLLSKWSTIQFVQSYISNGLNHFVFLLTF